jgi:hypothetical protein
MSRSRCVRYEKDVIQKDVAGLCLEDVQFRVDAFATVSLLWFLSMFLSISFYDCFLWDL